MLYSGETENNESKEAQKIAKSFDNCIRGAFKVDLRICLHYKELFYDVCNVEFARNGDIEKKCVSDATKVMLEGKCILDQIVKLAKLDDDAKELQVLNLQFCGLKGAIIGVRFEKTGRGYVAENVGRTLRMPIEVDNITKFFESVVAALLLVKERAEKNASLIEASLNRDSSVFGSQSPTPNCTLLKTTWLGPKPSSPKVIPPLPQTFLC
ncbi:hypothetical protein INT48_005620 [Thamnidium elegans]|uniref:Uncharacterized protein n=1 Tax=Thamnidium elegans TaxID=101142 RepID=A0A8H7SPA8_9FUNG|nr:hypothetical protein INT48_005620 [Thamnidium elegans]